MPNRYGLLFSVAIFISACSTTALDKQPYDRYTLDNGMEVLIWPNRNSHSNNEVRMDLVIKAGSEDEHPDQAGLAHFVEHMAFEQQDITGDNPIDTWLDHISLDTQAHANAYTSYDRTNYYLEFNNTSVDRLQVGLNILAYIAQETRFDKTKIEQEKSVIQAEWRYRTNSDSTNQKLFDRALEQHPWQALAPIGNMAVIAQVTPAQLAQFYRAHYRPDNALLVVAGDVDVTTLKAQINDAFSAWQNPEPADQVQGSQTQDSQAQDRVLMIPSDNIRILQATDLVGSLLRLEGFHPSGAIRNEQDLRRREMMGAIFHVLQQRLSRLEQEKSFNMQLYADYGYHVSHRHLEHFVFDIVGQTQDLQQATQSLVTEWARMAHYGLTQDELDSWRKTVLQTEKNNLDSAKHLATKAVDSLLNGDLLQGQTHYYHFLKNELPTFTTQDIQHLASEILTFNPRITLIQNPTEQRPSETQLRQWSHWPQQVSAPLGLERPTEIWAVHQQPGRVSEHETLANGIEIFTLGNGIKVFYSRFKTDTNQIQMQFVAKGGLDMLSDKEAIDARFALSVMAASGLRSLDGQALNHWLNERDMTLNPYFTFFTRELALKAPLNQEESLFRLAHIALTEAQVNEQVLAHYQQNSIAYLQQQSTHNRDAFDRQVESVLYQGDARLRRMTEREIQAMTQNDLERLYQHHYAGAQNYHLYIVGDLAPSLLKKRLQDYVANLPVNPVQTSARVHFPKLPQSQRVAGEGVGGHASFITLMYELDREHLPNVTVSMLEAETRQFSEQLTLALREQLGLTYAIQANFSGASEFNDSLRLQVDFSVAPEQVDLAIEMVNHEIAQRAEHTIEPLQIDQQLTKLRNHYADAMQSDNRMMLMATANVLYRSMDSVLDANRSVETYQGPQVNLLYRGFISEQARHVTFVLHP